MTTICSRWTSTFTKRAFATSSRLVARQGRLPRKQLAPLKGPPGSETDSLHGGVRSDRSVSREVARLWRKSKHRTDLLESTMAYLMDSRRGRHALMLRGKISDERLRPSPILSARLLVLQHHFHKISPQTFQRKIRTCLLEGEQRVSTADFASFMKSLERTRVRAEVMEEVFDLFVSSNPHDVPELGSAIAALVSRNLWEGNISRADHWLDLFREKVSTSESSSIKSHAAPFAAYIRAFSKQNYKLRSASAEELPAHDYSPIIAKMHEAQIWPDTNFINALVQAELLQDRATQALALYEFLRRQGAGNAILAPNSETHSSLFEVFRRLTRRQREVWKRNQAQLAQVEGEDGSSLPALTPWSVFSDMIHGQRRLLSTRREVTSQREGEQGEEQQERHEFLSGEVLTTRSTIAALRMFVETADYTCALAALATFAEFRLHLVAPRTSARSSLSLPFSSPSAGGVIVRALTNRCRSELSPRRSRSSNLLPTWTDIFLGLAPGERSRLSHTPRADTEWRVRQLAGVEIDYVKYPALRTFIVSDEKFQTKELALSTSSDHGSNASKAERNLEMQRKRWRARQLRVLSTLLHHAVIAEAKLAIVNTERPEDVLLRSLLTSGPLSGKSRVFM